MNIDEKIRKIIDLMEKFPDEIYFTGKDSGIPKLAEESWLNLDDKVVCFFRRNGEIGFGSGGRIGGEVFSVEKHGVKKKIRKLLPCQGWGAVVGGEESEIIIMGAEGGCVAVDVFCDIVQYFDDVFDVIIDYVNDNNE